MSTTATHARQTPHREPGGEPVRQAATPKRDDAGAAVRAAGNLQAQQLLGGGSDNPAGAPVQAQCAECAEEEQSEQPPVQSQCAECQAEDDAEDESPEESGAIAPSVQAKCAACDAEDAAEPEQERVQDPVQLWDCSEYQKPTCTAQVQVQTQCDSCGESSAAPARTEGRTAATVHREAKRGLDGASEPLPHGDRIQSAFGQHDISHIRTRTGGAAESANRRIGALAFASGSRIAFRQAPDLHLAAHEAAHVVQQRAGLSLPGNVGQHGDRWERHADRVADAVVSGRSAEPLLDDMAGRGSPSAPEGETAVQRRLTSAPTHLVEAPVAPVAVRVSAPTATAKNAQPQGADARATEGDAMDAAAEGGDGEAAPEGVTVGTGAATAPGDATATGGAAPPAPAGPSQGGGGVNAPCYDEEAEAPPDNTPEPSNDERSGEAQAKPQVTFDQWVDEVDQCPAEAPLAQGAQQATPTTQTASLQMATAAPQAAARQVRAAVGGGSGAAPPAAEGPESETSGESMGSAEGARDTAVAEYETASGSLDGVLTRAQMLDQRIEFAPGGDNARREDAVEQVRRFMRQAAARVEEAVRFARLDVPLRLGGQAEMLKSDVQAAIESEKANISARIAQARAQAFGSAAAARAHVQAEHAAATERIEAETDAAMTLLDEQYATSLDAVDESESTGLDDVNARFATGRTEHEEKGPDYAQRAIDLGQAHADAYEKHCKNGYADDGILDGCLTVRRAKAQQDAACKTAAAAGTGFIRTANEKAYNLKELRKVYRCAVIAGAQQVGTTLDDTYDRLISGLETGQAQALAALDQTRAQNLSAIDNGLNAALRSLASQEHAQRQGVNDAGYLHQLMLEQVAHTTAASLVQGIDAALGSLDETLVQLRERFAGVAPPDAASLETELVGTGSSLGAGMDELLGTMGSGLSEAETQMGTAASVATSSLADLTAQNDETVAQAESGFSGQMGGVMSGTTTAMGQIADGHVAKAQESATQGCDAMRQAVTAFDEALLTIDTRVTEALDSSLQQLDGDLQGKLNTLDAEIASEAWKAAEKEQPAWKSVVAIVLIIVVIIVATVISIVTLGAGASLFAVILIGALVGAVSAGLIQVINNWASGEDLTAGVGQAMIMGAIGGAIGGAFGFAGGALAAGATQAGARVATQIAITLTADLAAEAATQAVGYSLFGQEFNWQGFVMAGAMSGVSFRAHPSGARSPSPHTPAAHAPTPTPHAPAPHAEAPSVPHAPEAPAAPRTTTPEAPAAPHPGTPEAPTTPRPTKPEAPATPHATTPETPTAPHTTAPEASPGAAAGRRAAVTQIAGGALAGLVTEYAIAKISGQKFDPNRAISAAASAAAGARASRRAPTATAPTPTTRTGRAARRLRQFDPRGLGEHLGRRLTGLGERLAVGPLRDPTLAPRPATTTETGSTPPRQPAGGEEAPAPRRPAATEDGALLPRLSDSEIDDAFAGAQAGPLMRVPAGAPGADTRPAPRRPAGEPDLHQRQRAGALNEAADGLARQANDMLERAIAREAEADMVAGHNPRRAGALKAEADRIVTDAAALERQAGALRTEAEEFSSGRRSATEDLPGPDDLDINRLTPDSPGLLRVPLSDLERNPALLPRLIRPLLSGEAGGRMVFRVESERSRSLVHVDSSGNVRIEGGAMAHLNFGSFERAMEFVANSSRGQARIIQFEIDENWMRSARSAAIPETMMVQDGNRMRPARSPTLDQMAERVPALVDVRFGHDQLGLPPGLIGEANRFIVPGSGRVHEIPPPRSPGGAAPDSPAPPPPRAPGGGHERGPLPVEAAPPPRTPHADAAELSGPAKRMSPGDLIDATSVRARVGDTDHEFRIGQDGPEVCTTCAPIVQKLTAVINSNPTHAQVEQLKALRVLAADVQARLAAGESGVAMIHDAARIATEFRALAQQHKGLGVALENPRLLQTRAADGTLETSPHLRDLDADVVRTHTIAAADFRSVPMKKGDQAIYILRDAASGAVLKVGIAENHLTRLTQYANAGRKLGRQLMLDVAVVTPRSGTTIRDVEVSLRNRLDQEGQVLPWDNTGGRLGRSDRGTPFVHPVGKHLMWDANGHLVTKGSGVAPPAVTRVNATADELADLIDRGLSNKQIAKTKGVATSTVRRWRKRFGL